MNIKQQGVGLVEVLVSLVLLAIGVLGFIILQLKAIDASAEASQQVLALTIARDLAERMRANPQAVLAGEYNKGLIPVPDSSENSVIKDQPKDIAEQDLKSMALQASENGMRLSITDCLANNTRQCIYVAWNNTTFLNENKPEDIVKNCINTDGHYVDGSHCLYLEAY